MRSGDNGGDEGEKYSVEEEGGSQVSGDGARGMVVIMAVRRGDNGGDNGGDDESEKYLVDSNPKAIRAFIEEKIQ